MPDNVLKNADRFLLEVTAVFMADFRASVENGEIPKPTFLAQMRGALGQLGMSPTDREKLSVPEDDDSDGAKFAAYGKRAG